MRWTKIDRSAWEREEYFAHFLTDLPCTYSLTAKLDITALRSSGHSLYPAMLYAFSAIVNRHEEFRTALDEEGNPGIFDVLFPCYTVFHQDTQTFSNIWTEFSEDYAVFLAAYRQDLAQYGAVHGMTAKPDAPGNTFPVSMLPWTSFDGFHLHLQKGYAYLLPIFTMGKFYEEQGKTLLPIAVQVHHAVCDGFHVSRLIVQVQELLDALASQSVPRRADGFPGEEALCTMRQTT